MKVSFNAKINSLFAICGIFLAAQMVYAKGRSDLIEQLYSIKQLEPEPKTKSAMPKATKKTTTKK